MKEKSFAANKLYRLAYYDPLTDLPNRYFLTERIDMAIARVRESKQVMAVLLVDIDRFKNVNDTLGYAAGDDVLREAAARFRNMLGADVMVARIGGDEFVVLLEGLSDAGDVVRLSNNVRNVFRKPFSVADKEFYMTVSIGAAICQGVCGTCPGNCVDGSELLRRADVAKSRAKDAGRNQCRFSQHGMPPLMANKMVLEADLHRALKCEEFVLHYQPKVSLSTGRICGVEALIRWAHPVRGAVQPLDFIPILEESGLIVPVGEWIIRTACAQAAIWRRLGLEDMRIAINISAWQFQDAELVEKLKENLSRHALPPGAIEVEITESLLMKNPENAARLMQEMRELGIVISIDDFGTGYSSLAYLKRFPVDFLKIDRAFVQGLPHDESDAAICRAVLNFAAALGISVVAEGVETIAQANFMLEHDCCEVQGYLFSKPLLAEELECLFAEDRRLDI
jgi:diguanylate cyclase (GGDEF)-like protein